MHAGVGVFRLEQGFNLHKSVEFRLFVEKDGTVSAPAGLRKKTLSCVVQEPLVCFLLWKPGSIKTNNPFHSLNFQHLPSVCVCVCVSLCLSVSFFLSFFLSLLAWLVGWLVGCLFVCLFVCLFAFLLLCSMVVCWFACLLACLCVCVSIQHYACMCVCVNDVLDTQCSVGLIWWTWYWHDDMMTWGILGCLECCSVLADCLGCWTATVPRHFGNFIFWMARMFVCHRTSKGSLMELKL